MKDLHICRQLDIPSSWIDIAVASFVKESHLDPSIDPVGFYNMTIDVIAKAVLFGDKSKDFWVCYDDNGVISYSLCNYTIDIDNTLCYQVAQAWVRKDFRGRPIVKDWWKQIRQHAIDTFCKHIVVPSSRGSKVYERFLGFKPYMVVLKEDL